MLRTNIFDKIGRIKYIQYSYLVRLLETKIFDIHISSTHSCSAVQTSTLFLLFWRYLSSDFTLLFQISPNPPIPHQPTLYSFSAQGTNLSHVNPIVFQIP